MFSQEIRWWISVLLQHHWFTNRGLTQKLDLHRGAVGFVLSFPLQPPYLMYDPNTYLWSVCAHLTQGR